MRQSIVILLICAFSLQCFVKTGIFGYYIINKDYIISELCINKNKPEQQCRGKCHLKKQLKQQDNQEKKLPFEAKDLKELLLFLNSGKVTTPSIFLCFRNTPFSPLLFFIPSGPFKKIFHPPSFFADSKVAWFSLIAKCRLFTCL